MNWLLPLSLTAAVSALLGAGLTWYLGNNRIVGRIESKLAEGYLTDGAAQLLDVLATGGLILNSSNTVLRATVSAQAMGIVQNRILADAKLLELVEQARATNEPVFLTTDLSAGLSAEVVSVEARAAAIGGGNVLLLVEDRSEAKRLGDARRDFVANISHELKTPVGAIILLTEAIENASDDPQTVIKFARSLNRESQRLSSLVQDVIQLSKLQGGVALLDPQPVNLSDVIVEATDRNRVLAETRQITVKRDTDGDVWVVGDHEMLTSAVKNLVENAIIYSPPGSSVGVGLRIDGDIAEIAVLDHGVGIAPADQERVFERFYRVDESRSRETGGTGIGLAIVKHVAANHRGDVKLFSQLGLGSTFTLRLPIAIFAPEEPTESVSATATEKESK